MDVPTPQKAPKGSKPTAGEGWPVLGPPGQPGKTEKEGEMGLREASPGLGWRPEPTTAAKVFRLHLVPSKSEKDENSPGCGSSSSPSSLLLKIGFQISPKHFQSSQPAPAAAQPGGPTSPVSLRCFAAFQGHPCAFIVLKHGNYTFQAGKGNRTAPDSSTR